MYLKLTLNFFLSHKLRFATTVLSLTILVMAYLFMNTSAGTAQSEDAVPDIMYMNKVIDIYKWAYLEDLDPAFVAQFQAKTAQQAQVIAVTERFMLNVMNPMGDFRFHLFGVPQVFIDQQLAGSVVSGRAPQPGALEFVAGATAAKMFNLTVGSPFGITLAGDPKQSQTTYTLVGILNANSNVFLDRSFFVAGESYQGYAGKSAIPNAMLAYMKPGYKPEDIGTVASQLGGPTLSATVLKQGQFTRLMFTISNIILVLLSSLSLYQALMVILNHSTRQIGLLKAMGMSDLHVTLIFVQGITAIFALSMLAGFAATGLLFDRLNYEISKMLSAEVTIYKLSAATTLSILAMFFVALAIVVLSILYRTQRVPPRKVMLDL